MESVDELSPSSKVPSSRADRSQGRSSFYWMYAALLCILLFLGFGPTFFLRPLYLDEPLSIVLVAHGVMATSWFVLLLADE